MKKMEKKIYNDDFEQFLKETADDFRMYPSKRVWNSLYNNLHPGRKWPSLSVCLLLVSSIIFIGISHKNEIVGSESITKNSDKIPATNKLFASADLNKATAVLPVKQNGFVSDKTNQMLTATVNSTVNSITATKNSNTGQQQTSILKQQQTTTNTIQRSLPATAYQGNTINSNIAEHEPLISDAADAKNSSANSFDNKTRQGQTIANTVSEAGNENPVVLSSLEKYDGILAENSLRKNITLNIIEKELPVVKLPQLNTKNNSEKLWIDDYAFHNQPAPPLKSRLQYEVYVTPSIGFRKLEQTASYTAPAPRPSLVTSVPDGPNALQHNAAFNLELGYGYVYTQSKHLRLKAAVQLNYTSYKIHAHQLGHSTYTNLLIRDPYTTGGTKLSQRSSSLVNLRAGDNNKKLNSSTMQVSIPLGADVKFAGKHNLQWFIGATVQPTYVLFGNAYLISADSKNYVYDSKFLRKWNINAGVEAFVSYKTKRGITFNAGPQFRYQFLSSYKSKYTYDEKLYNIGIKFGMVRNF